MKYNVILLLSPDKRQVLMCRRQKPPFQGLMNLVGGKIRPGEDHLDAAYRELWEETSICRQDVDLAYLMRLSYPREDWILEAYGGTLKHSAAVSGEENPLLWVDILEDFTDETRFAGRGNLQHILQYYQSMTAQGD